MKLSMTLSFIAVITCIVVPPTSAGTWSDGFERLDLGEWKVHLYAGNQPVWRIENGLLLADHSACSTAWTGEDTWEDYSIEAIVTLLEERPVVGEHNPDEVAAGISMYGEVASCQGHFFGIYARVFDGRKPGLLAGFMDGWKPPTSPEYKAMRVEFGREYKLRMTEEGGLIKCYLDDELVLEPKMKFTAGVVALFSFNSKAHFDDFVVTGDSIPDGGPGLGKATMVEPVSKLATTWGNMKAERSAVSQPER